MPKSTSGKHNPLLNIQTKKVLQDLWQQKRRSMMIVLSIAIATLTVGIVLGTYAIVKREMAQSFQSVNPSNLRLSFSAPINDVTLLTELRDLEGIKTIEATRHESAQIINAKGEKHPLQIFAYNNIHNIAVDRIQSSAGVWPLAPRSLAIEQQALTVLGTQLGQLVTIELGLDKQVSLPVTATAHDVVRPQAEWENIVYAYMAMDTLKALNVETGFNNISIIVNDDLLDQKRLEAFSDKIQRWFNDSRYPVPSIELLDSTAYPHANILEGMFMLQIAFAIFCGFLSSILVINLISASLKKQSMHIAIFKTFGAQPRHIRFNYFLAVFILGTLGIALGILPSFWMVNTYVDFIASMLNIDILSFTIPHWVFLVQILLGLFLPLILTALPIHKASHISIRTTLLSYSTSQQSTNSIENLITRSVLSLFPARVRMAIRNIFRWKLRFFISALIFAVGGALFISSYNISNTIKTAETSERQEKNWEEILHLSDFINQSTLTDILAPTLEISKIEMAFTARGKVENFYATFTTGLNLYRLPKGSTLYSSKVLSGRPLSQLNNAIVINQNIAKKLPETSIGDTIKLTLNKKTEMFVLSGIVSYIGGPTAFINQSARTSQNNPINTIYIKEKLTKEENKKLIQVLEENGVYIASIKSADDATKILSDHLEIIFLLMALLTSVVIFISINGIILSVTSNIIERKREIAILKTIGATAKDLFRLLSYEVLFISIFAWLLAVIISIPISRFVTSYLGKLLIETPLQLALSINTYFIALPFLLAIGIAAATIPIWKFSKSSIHEAMTYE